MAPIYDEATFQKFYAKAVKSVDEIVIGKTYYSNIGPHEFTVLSLENDADYHKSVGLVGGYDQIEWIHYGGFWPISLRDRNIGAHYNPWMIFENEADAVDCRDGLNVTFTPPMDDWDYHSSRWFTHL